MTQPPRLNECLPREASELLNLELDLLDLLAALYTGRGVRAKPLEEKHVVVLEVEGKRVDLGRAEPLEKLGLVEKHVEDRVLRCPQCDYLRLTVKLQCPNCGSTNIEKIRIIQHIICGYIDLEINFRRGGQLVCPHCGAVLMSEADYKVLGSLYFCHNCRMRFHEPNVMLRCERCGATFRPVDAPYKPVYTLRLTDRSRRLLEKAHDLRIAVYTALSRSSLSFACNARLRGATGIEYDVDFLVQGEKVAIDIVPELKTHADAMLRLVKARDLMAAGHVSRYVLVTRSAARDAASLLVNTPLQLLEASLPSRVAEQLPQLLGGRGKRG